MVFKYLWASWEIPHLSMQGLGSSLHVGLFPAQEVVGWPAAEMSLAYCLYSSHPGGAGLLNARDPSWFTGWSPHAGSSWVHMCCLGCGSERPFAEAKKRAQQLLGEWTCFNFFLSLVWNEEMGRQTIASVQSLYPKWLKALPRRISSALSVSWVMVRGKKEVEHHSVHQW